MIYYQNCINCFRTVTVTFEDGQSLVRTSVAILDRTLSSNLKTFYVQLTNPRYGAILGTDSQVTINIHSNFNLYGVIQFDPVYSRALY